MSLDLARSITMYFLFGSSFLFASLKYILFVCWGGTDVPQSQPLDDRHFLRIHMINENRKETSPYLQRICMSGQSDRFQTVTITYIDIRLKYKHTCMYVVLIKLLSLCFLLTNTLSPLFLNLCLHLCLRLRLRPRLCLRHSLTLTHIKFSIFSIYDFISLLSLRFFSNAASLSPFTMRSTPRTGQEVRAATGPAGRQLPRRAACSPDSGRQYMDGHRKARRGSSRSGTIPAPRQTDSQF